MEVDGGTVRNIREHDAPSRRYGAFILAAVALALVCSGAYKYWHSPARGLPYVDSFAAGKAEEWKAFGGTWELSHGSMRNASDERGAKLVTGSVDWQNYSIEADMMLLGLGGDAGLLVRSSHEEEGVDAYEGYYAGLRTVDNALTLGRAGYGWMEVSFPLKTVPVGVQPSRWYHLKLLSYGCRLAASAGLVGQANPTVVSIEDKTCIPRGRVGLRSYSSGGVWRNVVVRPSTRQELEQMLVLAREQKALPVNQNVPHSADTLRTPPVDTIPRELPPSADAAPISTLRVVPVSQQKPVTVHGTVILTSPTLFLQDATGGVRVEQEHAASFKVGDEVETTGDLQPGTFSSTIAHATVRLLWEGTPTPAVSITATQAATGAFDATFVELTGTLRHKAFGSDGALVFDLDSDAQSFRAIMQPGRGDTLYNELNLGSMLRLRGVSVTDPAYTQYSTPFAVLMRSSDDLQVVAGPPWWSLRHLVAIGVSLLLLSVIAYLVFRSVENARLHAVVEERQRLAYEMHDTLAQSVAGIGFQLEAIRIGTPQELARIHQQLDVASDLVRQSHEEARTNIRMLKAHAVKSENLVAALSECAKGLVAGGEVRVLSGTSGVVSSLPLRVVDALYRIGQEALANVVRHAQATELTILLEYQKETACLLIGDNGRGFVPAGEDAGFGLRGMQSRAHGVGAVLEIHTEIGKGTKVRVTSALAPRVSLRSLSGHLLRFVRGNRRHVATCKQSDPHPYRG